MRPVCKLAKFRVIRTWEVDSDYSGKYIKPVGKIGILIEVTAQGTYNKFKTYPDRNKILDHR